MPGQIIKNQINLDLIKIIQFCLKIYYLLTHSHLYIGNIYGWVDGWVILLTFDFLLKLPQCITNYFLLLDVKAILNICYVLWN